MEISKGSASKVHRDNFREGPLKSPVKDQSLSSATDRSQQLLRALLRREKLLHSIHKFLWGRFGRRGSLYSR